MTIRELCEKEVVQLERGVCLGRADDRDFDPATARLQTALPEPPPQAQELTFWQKVKKKLGM